MNSRSLKCSGPLKRQRGIGLVEIMIAVTLGIIVTGAVVQIYLSTKRQNDMQGGLTGRQEVSRYATQLLQRDLQMAGFRGCLRDLGTVVNTLNDPDDFLNNYARHVEGFEDVVSAALPGEITAGGNDVVADTDVLVVRTVDDPNLQLTANMVTSSSDPVTVPGLDPVAPDTPAVGDIMLVTDCGGSAIFEVTAFDDGTGTITHDAGAGAPGNSSKNLVRRYTAGAQLFRLRTTTYFIRENDQGIAGLWRRVGDGEPQELAEGVENMQVLYGEDTIGADQVPDVYRTADAVVNWNNVVSLQVALLVSSVRENVADEDPRTFVLLDEAAVGPFADGRLRQVVSFTVAMRNRLS
ncbi:MAG: PilW family protein [Gammaproteobacteria bacterium]|nr:PilW family protein [Gammaproteobacteria bacterium]